MRRAAAIAISGLLWFLVIPAAQASHEWAGMDFCSGHHDTAHCLDPDTLTELHGHADDDRLAVDSQAGAGVASTGVTPTGAGVPQHGPGRLGWLTPFFALAGLGLWRWWARRRGRESSQYDPLHWWSSLRPGRHDRGGR